MHFLKMATKLEYSENGIWAMGIHIDHKIEVSKKQFVMAAVASVNNQIGGATITLMILTGTMANFRIMRDTVLMCSLMKV